MTDEERQFIRLEARLEAMRVLVQGLYNMQAQSSKGARIALLASLSVLREDHQSVAPPGVSPTDPEVLLAAEYREALDDYITEIEDGLNGAPAA